MQLDFKIKGFLKYACVSMPHSCRSQEARVLCQIDTDGTWARLSSRKKLIYTCFVGSIVHNIAKDQNNLRKTVFKMTAVMYSFGV